MRPPGTTLVPEVAIHAPESASPSVDGNDGHSSGILDTPVVVVVVVDSTNRRTAHVGTSSSSSTARPPSTRHANPDKSVVISNNFARRIQFSNGDDDDVSRSRHNNDDVNSSPATSRPCDDVIDDVTLSEDGDDVRQIGNYSSRDRHRAEAKRVGGSESGDRVLLLKWGGSDDAAMTSSIPDHSGGSLPQPPPPPSSPPSSLPSSRSEELPLSKYNAPTFSTSHSSLQG